MKEELLKVAACRPELKRPGVQFAVLGSPAARELQRGAPDPSVDGIGVQPIQAEEKDAIGDFRAHAGKELESLAGFLDRHGAKGGPRDRIAVQSPRGLEEIGGSKSHPKRAEVRFARLGEDGRHWEGPACGPRDEGPESIRDSLDGACDLRDVRRGGADERRQGLPRFLSQEAETEERHEAGKGTQRLDSLEMNGRILAEAKVVAPGGGSRILADYLQLERPIGDPGAEARLGEADNSGPGVALALPAEGLTAAEGEIQIKGTEDGEEMTHPKRLRGGDRGVKRAPAEVVSVDPARSDVGNSQAMRVSRLFVVVLVLGALAAALAPKGQAVAESITGRASVHLVRLLEEVPDSLPSRMGPVHDIRLRLVRGNVLVLKHQGDFIALLPIERQTDGIDSLQYFYFAESGPLLWIFPGAREKAIRTVGDGGIIQFHSSRLIWRSGPGFGWIYFPDVAENEGLKFSVVSGGNVDQADPRDTKYWVELGTPGGSGF